MEDIREQLTDIWNKYQVIDNEVLRDRGYLYCNNVKQKDILITGINPSYIKDKDNNLLSYDFKGCYGRYWSPIMKMLKNETLDYTDNTAYLDLFYFRATNQKYIKDVILKHNQGIGFLAEQLRVTQQLMEEVIKPKVIIIKNKESYAYWGKLSDKGYVWMGYEFEPIESIQCGEVCRITKLINSNERIFPEITHSNLTGSIVLFSKYSRFLRKDEKITADVIERLLKLYNS